MSGQHVYGEVDRPDGTSIVTASTLEWAVRRHLYRYVAVPPIRALKQDAHTLTLPTPRCAALSHSGADKTACASVGAVMAARLKESGLTSVFFDRQGAGYHGKVSRACLPLPSPSVSLSHTIAPSPTQVKSFIDAVVENGISLKE